MKKVLLLMVCALMGFTLTAQVMITEDFSASGYAVGGKIAQQAHAMGKDYWTTWSQAPGGSEDGVIDEMPAGNKCGKFVGTSNQAIDQILRLGKKEGSNWVNLTTGKWELTFKIYIPTGKDGYFNIKSVFPSADPPTWALQVYMGTDEGQYPNPGPSTPGQGACYGGAQTPVNFNFSHDTWVPIKIFIDLDDDICEFYVNGTMIHTYQYSTGSFGQSNHRYIAAFNMFPPNYAATSLFYIDDIVFLPVTGGPTVLFDTCFDDVPNGSKVAVSYPDWWTTWSDAPGGAEDGTISNEQSSSVPQSAKVVYGNDIVFKAGDKTTGEYQLDFEMYIPSNIPAYFNLLHLFQPKPTPGAYEWAVGVYFNIPTNSQQMPVGTNIRHNGALTPFTAPSNTWFPVSILVNLDADEATMKVNDVHVLTWAFSIKESGGTGQRQLAAISYWPPLAGSYFYIDNFVYSMIGGETEPKIVVIPDKIEAEGPDVVTVPVVLNNIGTSMGDYFSWVVFDATPEPGTNNYTITYATDAQGGGIGYNNGPHTVEVAAKYQLSDYCDKAGTYINKVAYYMRESSADNKLTARIYGGGNYSAPGAVLAEKTITNPVIGMYNEITLDTPVLLDGQDIWVAFEFIQPVGGYLMTYDDELAVENSNWERNNGGSWSQLKMVHQPTPNTPIGCWMRKAFTTGTPYGCWLSLAGDTYGNVKAGAEKTFNVTLDPTKLAQGVHTAKLYVNTNNKVDPLFTIPIIFTVGVSTNCEMEKILVDGVEATQSGNKFTITVEYKDSEKVTIEAIPENSAATVEGLQGEQAVEPDKTTKFDYKVTAESGIHTKDFVLEVKMKKKPDAISEVDNATIKLFPNPVSDNLYIQSEYKIELIRIYDLAGKMVKQVKQPGEAVNLSDLAAGYYLLKVTTEQGEAMHKFVKD